MPTFRITSPDGKSYEVTAPEGATQAQALKYAQAQHAKAAPMTTVRLPDGSEVDVPTNDRKQAASAARKHWDAKQAGPGGTFGAAAGNVLDNLLPNWGDEVAGGVRLLSAKLGSGRDPKTAFADGQRELKEQQAHYKDAHPVLSTATAVGGMGLGMVVPAGRMAEGASMAGRMAHGAAVGAGYGAASGAGEGKGLEQRYANARRSALPGAATGALMAPLATAAVGLGRAAIARIPGVEPATRMLANVPRAVMRRPLMPRGQRATERADRFLGDQMSQGHVQAGFGQTGAPASPAAILADVERRQALGVPAIAGDVTQHTRGATSWASRGMGPGQSRVIAVMEERKAQEALRVRQHVIDTMGEVGDPIAQTQAHSARAKADVAPLYREAYATPMVVTPEIEEIMRTPAFRDALPQAVTNIRNAQRVPTELGFRVDGDGNYEGINTLTTEAYDQVIRAMRDDGRRAMDTTGFRPMDTTNSTHINARARDLRDEVTAQAPAYGEALTRYADEMGQRDALEAGRGVRSLSGHDIREQARAIPDTAHASWSLGARTALADEASQFGAAHPTGDTSAHVRKALGDDTKQAALGEITGNTGAVRGLQERLEAERQGHITWAEINGNSKTAHRQALDADMDAAVASVPSLLSPRGLLTAAAGHVANIAQRDFTNAVKGRVGEVMTERDPEALRRLMGEIETQGDRDRAFAASLHRTGIGATRAYGANIAPNEAE